MLVNIKNIKHFVIRYLITFRYIKLIAYICAKNLHNKLQKPYEEKKKNKILQIIYTFIKKLIYLTPLGRLFSYLSEKLSQMQTKEEIIHSRYTYYYGFEFIFGGINKFLILFIIGLSFNILLQIFIMSLSFASLRVFSGGLHLNSYTKCCYYSLIIFTLTSLLAKYIPFNDILNVITYIVTFIIIFIYAPVEHPNRPLTEKEKIKFKSISMFILGVLFVTTHYVDVTISNCIMYGILLAGLITLPVINKLK